jgi:acyl transferase domain-containing protein
MRRQHLEHRRTVIGTTHGELVAALDGTGTPAADPALAEIAARYRAGETVDWEAMFGNDRYVPLPTYPWQTKRYWPGEEHEQDGTELAAWILRQYVRTDFHAESTLADIGIDSLAKLQLIVEVQKMTGHELDPEVIGRLRTVSELRQWTQELEAVAR